LSLLFFPFSCPSTSLGYSDQLKKLGMSISRASRGFLNSTKPEQVAIINGNQVDSDAPVSYDHTHRKLKSRHVQLIGIGGTIGTGLYVAIGLGLLKGGPGSLFLGFAIW